MADTPFYQWLPEWVYTSLSKRVCSQCKEKYTKNGIIAVGIRTVDDDSCALYIEHQCSMCDYRALTTMGKQKEDTLEKLCYVILESIKKKKITDKSKMMHNYTSSKPITDREVKDFKEFMKENKTHADFLRKIGVYFPPENKDKDNKDDTG